MKAPKQQFKVYLEFTNLNSDDLFKYPLLKDVVPRISTMSINTSFANLLPNQLLAFTELHAHLIIMNLDTFSHDDG